MSTSSNSQPGANDGSNQPTPSSIPDIRGVPDIRAGDIRDGDHDVEVAIAQYLIAEDEGRPLVVDVWLDANPLIRDRLIAFLDNQRHTASALGFTPIRTTDTHATGSTQDEPMRSPSSKAGVPPNPKDLPAGSHPVVNDLMDTLDFDLDGRVRVPISGPSLLPIHRIGNYRLQRLLGTGGMGRVYEAIDEHGHRFAIKLIASVRSSSPETIERFRQEGMIASSLNHERCVFVHAADTADGQPFIAMELMPGTTLRDLVQSNGPLSVPDALEKILDVIDGLHAAHQKNLIHRDVKPSNCYLDTDGRVKVGDFGLAKSVESDAGLTRTGSIVGTPLFASPEQLRGEALDGRSDIYSTCATLYYLLTGKAPFEHTNPTTVIARALTEDPAPIVAIRSDVPEGLFQVLSQGMSRNRDQRPHDMAELREQLAPFLPGARQPARLPFRFAAACIDVAIVSLVVGIAALLRPDWFATQEAETPQLRFESHVLTSLLQALYLFVCEYRFQTTLGKRLLGLRVQTSDPHQPWTLWRVAIRIGLWWLLTGIGSDMILYWSGHPWMESFLGPTYWIGYGISFFLLSAPLLWRNDRRMLHDLLSGTSVERIAELSTARSPLAWSRTPEDESPVHSSPAGRRFGRFVDAQPFLLLGECQWYLGTDPALRRKVWIAERPATFPELPESRRRVARSTRLRWITSGLEANHRWDAFLALDSLPVTEMHLIQSSIDWKTMRRGLLDLAREVSPDSALRGSDSEHDGPGPLSFDRRAIRITRDGQLIWFDDLGSDRALEEIISAREPADRRVLDLLHTVAASMQSLAPSVGTTSSKPILPYRAMQCIERLDPNHPTPIGSVAEFIQVIRPLDETSGAPTLRQRLLHIAPQLALGLIPFGAMLSALGVGHLIRLGLIQDELLRLQALQVIATSDARESSLAVLQKEAQQMGKELPVITDERWLSSLHRAIAKVGDWHRTERIRCSELDMTSLRASGVLFIEPNSIEWLTHEDSLADGGKFVWKLPSKIPKTSLPGANQTTKADDQEWVAANEATRGWFERIGVLRAAALVSSAERVGTDPHALSAVSIWRLAIVSLFGWVFLSLWGMIFRGGIGRKIAGMVIVNAQGKLASRWRLLWRSALLWAPLGLLMFAIIYCESNGWFTPWVSFVLRTACMLLPLVYAVIGLLSRQRGVHDQIAGTWLIPH